MKKAVAIGELLIDFVPQQKGCAARRSAAVRACGRRRARQCCDGSRAARRRGENDLGRSGEDAFGTHILKVLRASNVDISSVFRTNRANTALAFVSLDAAGNREFSFYRNPSADLFLDEKQITPEMFESCAVLHFCSVDLVDYPVRGAHPARHRACKAGRSLHLLRPERPPAALEQSGGLSGGDTAVPALCGFGQAER